MSAWMSELCVCVWARYRKEEGEREEKEGRLCSSSQLLRIYSHIIIAGIERRRRECVAMVSFWMAFNGGWQEKWLAWPLVEGTEGGLRSLVAGVDNEAAFWITRSLRSVQSARNNFSSLDKNNALQGLRTHITLIIILFSNMYSSTKGFYSK